MGKKVEVWAIYYKRNFKLMQILEVKSHIQAVEVFGNVFGHRGDLELVKLEGWVQG